MNILFLSLLDFKTIEEHNIYTDLLRKFYEQGHCVYAVSPVERKRERGESYLRINDRVHIIKPRIGNIQKTNAIEKGISTVLLETKVISAIKQYFASVRFDLILYTTPPITLQKAVKYVKKRDHAFTYLMLKDIFPQNAVDMGMLSMNGVKGILYKYFRNKEIKLYRNSDYIGCMSEANVSYLLRENPQIRPEIVEVCPNSIEIEDRGISVGKRQQIRQKYGIPLEKKVFVYGGNLGRPQGISFLIECLESQEQNEDIFFLIIGSGTEYQKLSAFIEKQKPGNMKLLEYLPKEDFDNLVGACDVGMIFLDHRFTIPNFPSRLLAYMQARIPVLAVTDVHTDVGKVITEGKFGWWCESNSVEAFCEAIQTACNSDLKNMGDAGYHYLEAHYSVDDTYRLIISHWEAGTWDA